MDFAPGLVKVTLRPRPGYVPKVLSASFRCQVVPLHSFHPPPFASHALSCPSFEDLCGPLQPLEKISPVAGMFWCWPPWACQIKAQIFSLGEGCYFAGI